MSNTQQSYTPPRLQRLYEYWRSKFRNGYLPARKDIDPIEIPDLLSGMILIDVEGKRPDRHYRFRLLGSEFVDAVGENLTGKRLDEIGSPGSTDPIISGYEEAVIKKSPHFWESFIHVEGRKHVRYRRLVCPLASDGITVDTLAGVFAFNR